MKILDKYIANRLLIFFLFILVSTSLSIELIDFVNKMDFFKNLPAKDIFLYYLSYMPFMLNFLAPIVSFMASVVVTMILAGNSEIIASLSIGIKFKRLVFPYLIFAFFISILSFIFSSWIIPNANKYKIIFEINHLNKHVYNNLKNIHIKIDEDKYAYVQYYNAFNNEGYNFTLESIDQKLNGKLYAEKITWIPEKQVWRAKNWSLRKINGLQENLKEGYNIDLELNLEPADFGADIHFREMFNLIELNRYIEKLEIKKSDSLYLFKVEKYTRFMYPFSIILLVLIGMIFASKKMRAGTIWQSVLGFLLSITYIALFMFASNRAESHSSNILITLWMPNIVFSILVAFIYRVMPK